MTMDKPKVGGGDPTYVLERGEAETRRLGRQAAFQEPLTRRLFAEAGIAEGMRVLDLGSGAGDVAFLAAEMVGPTGSVVGVDADPRVLRTARARAGAAGLTNVEFLDGDLRAVDPGDGFDAVVGRFVLMYLSDPAGALRAVMRHLRPGGIVAFQEFNFTRGSVVACPPTPLWERLWDWMRAVVRRAGVEMEMGYKLHRTFLEAGLPAPELILESIIAGASNVEAHEYAATTLGSMLPLLVGFGIATEEEVDIGTLATRLQAETAASGGVVKTPDVVRAHARKAGPEDHGAESLGGKEQK